MVISLSRVSSPRRHVRARSPFRAWCDLAGLVPRRTSAWKCIGSDTAPTHVLDDALAWTLPRPTVSSTFPVAHSRHGPADRDVLRVPGTSTRRRLLCVCGECALARARRRRAAGAVDGAVGEVPRGPGSLICSLKLPSARSQYPQELQIACSPPRPGPSGNYFMNCSPWKLLVRGDRVDLRRHALLLLERHHPARRVSLRGVSRPRTSLFLVRVHERAGQALPVEAARRAGVRGYT